MKINDKIELEIIDVNYNGQGLAKSPEGIVFVNGALKGEKVLVEIIKMTKKFILGRLIEVINESPNRITPKCKYINECGGCDFMHTSSALIYKKDFVKVTMEKQLHREVLVNDVLFTEEPYNYRNKVIFSLGQKDGKLKFGFYKQGSHNLVDINECINAKEIINEVSASSVEFINHSSIDKSLLKYMMIRTTSLNEVMIVFVASKKMDISSLAIFLEKTFPSIKSIYLNINKQNSNLPLGTRYILVYGEKTVTEEVNGLIFNVSPQSFMQVNTKASELLYNEAIKRLDPKGTDTVIDAYSGIGTLSLMLAKKAKEVIGIEIVPEAVANANKNKKMNNMMNVSFVCGPAEEKIKEVVLNNDIDVISVDPPRKGCDKKLLDVIIETKIKKIVYISCKTSSLGRDASYLIDNGYVMESVTPVDLFSNTTNVECVTSFILGD